MKVERVSYDVMTPSAARGILEAIHWKPAIRWVIDRIHVLRPIRFQSIRRNEVGSKAPETNISRGMKRGSLKGLPILVDDPNQRQQRASTVLTDVAYVIAAHFELTGKAEPDDTEAKHISMFNRRAESGQCFHQPCLGTREFAADFYLIPHSESTPEPKLEDRTAELGFGTPRDLGFMLWDIDHQAKDKPSLLFRARLENGIVTVPAPGSPDIRR
jgi:CRISPR-associated protein Cas5d